LWEYYDSSYYAKEDNKLLNYFQPPRYPNEKCAECMQMDGMRLAQAYVPPQNFEALYEPKQALCAGTVFEQLDMPYKKKK